MQFAPLTTMADQLMIYKYCIHMVANVYGKTATFMPKPVYGDNGSGMHCHQSIWKGRQAGLRRQQIRRSLEICLSYIAGVIKHAKAINAFSNPTTNSYKRLVPGFEAPVLPAHSARNRSASCRIPHTSNPKAKRVEVRFPIRSPIRISLLVAMLMAGLDGVKNKLDPAIDKDLTDSPPAEFSSLNPDRVRLLREALNASTRIASSSRPAASRTTTSSTAISS
ncbi:MAG: hypothetical protein R3D52_02470 [Xanthobacteraceae bacterium]